MRFFLFIQFAIFNFQFAFSQLPAIGIWRDHLPYGQAMQVLNSSDKIWCATPFSVFSIDKSENSIDRLSKINGLHETGVRCIGFDQSDNILVIAYKNSNIDILQGSNINNIDAIKNSFITGDKAINDVYAVNKQAYLSTGIGIIVIDLSKNEIRGTYIIGNAGNKIKINAVTSDNNYLYAATEEGLKRVPINTTNPADFRNWELISGTSGLPAGEISDIAILADKILAVKQDSLFISTGNNWSFLYTDGSAINNLDIANEKILLSESQNNTGKVVILTPSGVEQIIQNSNFTVSPRQTIIVDNNYWIADSVAGLSKFNGNNFESYVPNSPAFIATGKMNSFGNTLWVAAGSVTANWEPANNKNGLYQFSEGSWKNYNYKNIPALDTLPDFITVAIDPKDQSLWAGSYGGGLANINSGNSISVFKQNSPVQPAGFSPNSYRISGLNFDFENNLWIANYGANNNLLVRKADGNWQSFSVPFPLAENAISEIITDDLNQQWMIAPKSQGLICFNYGQSIDNTSDDQWKWYRSGAGNGNLPDNNVLCIVKDKNNFIWVGTAQGVGIIECPQQVFTALGCEAILPVVQQDNFAGYLFRDEQVQTISVDGADRKWVGTKNGVWLISPDGEKTIYHFTEENSPLPGNDVNHITIDGSTGEVFFSTNNGICSFRSTATEGGNTNSGVLVFPNPVPPGYTGTIAIRGVVNNAIVKITELNGRMIYQTRALGGQAIWNGKNYKGQAISTGVYLVLVSDENNREKIVTKIVFIKK